MTTTRTYFTFDELACFESDQVRLPLECVLDRRAIIEEAVNADYEWEIGTHSARRPALYDPDLPAAVDLWVARRSRDGTVGTPVFVKAGKTLADASPAPYGLV